VNGVLILKCGALDRFIANNLLREKTRRFQDHPSRLEETEYPVKAMTDSRAFLEFVGRSKRGGLKSMCATLAVDDQEPRLGILDPEGAE
jgi:hypothetical protein